MSNKPKKITILRAKKRSEKRDTIDFLFYLISQKTITDSQKLTIAGKMAEVLNK